MHFSLLRDITMSDEHHSGLLYGLEHGSTRFRPFSALFQHVLAGTVGIIAAMIIGATLGLATGRRISSV